MNYEAIYADLNIVLGDSDDFTFTPEEKQRALDDAWHDRYVYTSASQDMTYSVNTRSYDFSSLTKIENIEYASGSEWGRTIPGDAYTVRNGVVYIEYDYRYSIPDGATLTAVGVAHPDTSDTLNDNNVVEYVLVLAQYNTLKLLGAKKTNKFLKNDTTMADIINQRRELEREILAKRQALQSSYERS